MIISEYSPRCVQIGKNILSQGLRMWALSQHFLYVACVLIALGLIVVEVHSANFYS